MDSEQDDRIEADPGFVAEMKAKTEAVYKAFQQAHQAMRSASRAIDELQAVMPQELSTFGPPPQHYPSSNHINRKHAKSTSSAKSLSTRHNPYTKPNILPAPPQNSANNMSPTSTISPTKRSRGGGPRSPGKHQPSISSSHRREPPEFTPEQAELLDEFIKYFNLRVEGTNIPQWKIGAEISEFAGNSIKMDQSTVSRMARRLGVPKSQTGVEAVKKWITNEKQRLAAAKHANASTGQDVNATKAGIQDKQPPPTQQQQQPPPPLPPQHQELPTQPSLVPSSEAATVNGSEKKD